MPCKLWNLYSFHAWQKFVLLRSRTTTPLKFGKIWQNLVGKNHRAHLYHGNHDRFCRKINKNLPNAYGPFPSLLKFQTFIFHRLPCLSSWRSILELHKDIFFKDPLKRHSRYNDFRRHCRLIKYSTVSTGSNLRISATPWNLPRIRAEDSTHKDTTKQGSDRKDFSQHGKIW